VLCNQFRSPQILPIVFSLRDWSSILRECREFDLFLPLSIPLIWLRDDLEYLPVIASLPADQTVFEYLIGCWKRVNTASSAIAKRKYPPVETQQANEVLDKLRDLVISYAGLSLQEPEMFPQPQKLVSSDFFPRKYMLLIGITLQSRCWSNRARRTTPLTLCAFCSPTFQYTHGFTPPHRGTAFPTRSCSTLRGTR
jgi:hypothetical protein